jgi:hypothetical protein
MTCMKKDDKKRCGICDIPYFERNNYYHGKLMTVRDFFAEQCYSNEKRWLINRMIHGWGVMCGLDVKQKPVDPGDLSKGYDPHKVLITPGLALDCCGREILVCKEQEVVLVPEVSECDKEKPEDETEKKLVLCLEFHECKTEPIHLPPIACDQKETCEFNRIRDSYKILVKHVGDVDIEDPYAKNCPLIEDKPSSLHDYLCKKLKDGCPQCPEKPCLVLAEITITPTQDPNAPPPLKIDQCSKRRLIFNNALLFDLINCFHGDLPHVIDINWKENGATLSWEDWADPDKGIYTQGAQIEFDKKMNGDTINDHTFIVMVKMIDADTGNYRYELAPGDVSYSYDDTTGKSTATFKFTSKWLIDVYFGYSSIRQRGGEFKVVLKSVFIMSAEESGKPAKALDGNFIGGRLPSGNGTAGGDFVSWFYVTSEPAESAAKGKSIKKK